MLTNSKKERLTKGIYHIQLVNSFHSHLKTWLSSQGVAAKTAFIGLDGLNGEAFIARKTG
ncbi:hypothetical protein BIV59_15365 [Bacillus sp. MUM 13]|nr:hypothetical protein BIV59_15365 [Bacillus sp. MUM 13]